MIDRFKVAAVQMHSVEDKTVNLAAAARLVEEAVDQGAQLVVLPEYFNCLGRLEAMVEWAEPVPGPTSEAMSQLAARLNVTLQAGSLCEQCGQPGKAFNTSLLFGPDGKLLSRYRKLHLFDVDVPGQVTFKESSLIVPGDDVVTTDTPLGCLGHATCYDLRFPELFRSLVDRGMELLIFPSAFSAPTGRAHWEVLLRARAIENQVFVVAANQYGQHAPNMSTYGHSAIYDPWGVPLATADEGDQILVAEIDRLRLAVVRSHLPALTHRRQLEAT